MSLVECKHVTKKYGMKVALDDVNLTIEKGKIIGLLGPNGSGKTTLIKLLNDLLVPNSGEILIQGNHFLFTRENLFKFQYENKRSDSIF